MSLYQNSVLNKHLKAQDKDLVNKAYKKFTKHFHNPKIQENIRNSKEEQYQEGFLRELFVDVFGYTLNPQPKYNLTTELKNVRDRTYNKIESMVSRIYGFSEKKISIGVEI